MAIIRWDPFRDLVNMQEKMNRLFDNSLSARHDSVFSGVWSPAVDVYEVEDRIFVKAELPGVDGDCIVVEIKDNILTLRGERKIEESLQKENFHRIERNYGRFQRSFALSSYVDEENVTASFKNGVLDVVLPKLPDQGPKKIDIRVT